MKKESLIILTTIIGITAAFCIAGEPSRTYKNSGTGDIEVFARGCNPPPYKHGMDLLLNKMPDKEDTLRVGAFVQYLREIDDRDRWDQIIEDSFPFIDEAGKAFLVDFADGYTSFFHEYNTIPFSMFTVAEATSNSQGYYVFEDVEPGLYLVMCSTNRAKPQAIYKSYSNKPVKDTTLQKDSREPQRPQSTSEKQSPEKPPPDEPPADNPHPSKIPPYPRLIHREGKERCLPGAVNFIRVAPDSVSVVYVYAYDTGGVEIDSYHPDEWEGRMYERVDEGK